MATNDEWTPEKIATVEEMTTRLLNLWEISPEDQQHLLGRNIESASPDEILDRIGWLLSIHKYLRILYPKNPEIYYSWVRHRHEAFGGRTPLGIFLEEGASGMKRVAGYLQGIIAG